MKTKFCSTVKIKISTLKWKLGKKYRQACWVKMFLVCIYKLMSKAVVQRNEYTLYMVMHFMHTPIHNISETIQLDLDTVCDWIQSVMPWRRKYTHFILLLWKTHILTYVSVIRKSHCTLFSMHSCMSIEYNQDKWVLVICLPCPI